MQLAYVTMSISCSWAVDSEQRGALAALLATQASSASPAPAPAPVRLPRPAPDSPGCTLELAQQSGSTEQVPAWRMLWRSPSHAFPPLPACAPAYTLCYSADADP